MEKKTYKYILFDLDGTLTDPKEGITKCFQYALKHFGIEEELENLNKVIGPPLIDSFIEFYGLKGEKAKAAVDKYRERFSDIGIYENAVYDGIPEALGRIKESGRKIALATSKPLVFAKRILKHYDLERYFDVVMGAELSGVRNNKDEVIAEVLRLFGNPDPQDVLMVGDRKQDIIGAKKCGVASAGARFGYAEPNELEAEEPDYIVDTVEELEELILGGN